METFELLLTFALGIGIGFLMNRKTSVPANEGVSNQLLQSQRELIESRFKNLAQQILEEQSKKMQEAGLQNFGLLLNPLKEKLQSFEKQVQDVYGKESKERGILQHEINRIVDAQTRLSEDANRLARALRTESKTQGNWGEIVLKRILECAGLQEGREYIEQGKGLGLTDAEGYAQKPDYIVNLPDQKHIIIDSKVVINSFERFINSDDPTEKTSATNDYIVAVECHVKGLSKKQYQANSKLITPEYVLMFMPTEASYAFLSEVASTILQDAWKARVIIVGPTNLMACLKTIETVWRFERQNQNIQGVVDLGKRMINKFVDFTKDMEGVGNHIETAKDTWSRAMAKLSGKGGLISGMQRMEILGVPRTKEWPKGIQSVDQEESGDESSGEDVA